MNNTANKIPWLMTCLTIALIALLLAGRAAWAAPVASISFPENDLKPFINEPTTAEVCMQNVGSSDSVGFQPVIELIVPNGYAVSSFSYLGATIAPREASGSPCATLTGCTLDSPLQAVMPGRTRAIANGERYLTLEYPLGSFPDTQPRQCISFSLQPNAPIAVVGTPNTFNFTPIFTLGADPLNNPTTDPPIVGAAQEFTVTPQVIKHTKKIIAPEKETATGRNFIRTVELTVDVANLETVTGITVSDILPNSFQFVGITDAAGCSTPTTTPSTTIPGGALTLDCGAITGVVGVDRTIKFEFYVPEFDSTSDRVLNDINPGGGVLITNNSSANGVYTGNPVGEAAQDTITARAHAIQKSVAVTNCLGNTISGRGPRPGDCLRYTIVGQISDYFRVDNTVLTDVLGDGQTFRPGFTPTWSVTQGGATTSGNFTLVSNFIAAAKDTASGQTALTINLFDAMSSPGVFIGDESNSAFNNQPATYQIVFESTVDVSYTGTVNGTHLLSAGDSVANTANVASQVLGETTDIPTGGAATDGTGASVSIEGPTFAKNIFAVDGNTTLPNPLVVRPGQTVTYHIQYVMPFVSFENLTLTDYLPIPKLRATEVTAFNATADLNPPPAGQWKFTSAHTATTVTSPPTTLTPNATQNTLTWSFGDVESQDESQVIDILFTVTMTTDAIADNLNLANLVQIQSKNSSLEASNIDKVVNIKTAEPILEVVKKVRNTGVSGSTFADSISNADAGDVIQYQITVTNKGNGSAHKIKLSDDANTLGYYGSNCTSATVTGVASNSGDLFAGNLILTELTGNGDTTVDAGEQAAITYTCTIQPTAVPNAQNSLDNTASVTEYFSTATSTTNLAPAGFSTLSDKATAGIQEIQSITKAITASSIAGSTPDSNINNGEELTFLITATLSEGTYTGFALTDNTTTVPSPITCGSNGFTCTSNVGIAGSTVTVAGTNGSTPGVITYEYTQARAASGSNTATVSATNATPRTASVNWTVDDPNPVITKTFNPTGGVSAGDTVQVRLGWSNTDSDNPMFRCVISDVLDANVFDAIPVSAVTTPAGYTFDYNSGTRTVTYTATDLNTPCPTVAAGGAVFSARIKNDVITGNYNNTAVITTQTLPQSQSGGKSVTSNVTTPVPISAPTVSGKTITATSQSDTSGANGAIGEIITYQIVFRMAEGTTNSVTLIDQLAAGTSPAQLVYIPGTATLASNSATLFAANDPGGINSAAANSPVPVTVTASGQDIAVSLGNVVNNDANAASEETYTLTLQFRVGNVAANTGGRRLQNHSRLSYTPFSGAPQFVNGPSATVRVVVPQVAVSKVVTPAAGAAGNTETYTLTVRNSAAGTNAAPAYDYAFSDLLPADITPIGTPTANVGSTGAIVSGLAFSGQTLSGSINKLDPGEAITITYTGQISPATPFGRRLINSASANATTLPGSDANERNGSGSGPNNLFAGTSATITAQTVTLTKTLKNPKTFYAIGEEVEYELRLALPVGSATGMNVLDTLPSGLTYIAGSAQIAIVGGVTAPTSGSITPTAANPLTFALGTVTANPAGEVVISYRAKVANDLSNQDGVVRTNNARVSYDNPNPNGVSPLIYTAPNPPSIRVGEPNLEMTKSILAGAAEAQAGRIVRWQFTVSNIGNTAARQIAINDALPTNLTVNNPANIAVSSVGGVSKEGGGAVTDGDFTATPGSSSVTAANLVLEPGAVLTVAYDTLVGAGAVAGDSLNNQVTATYNSLPSGGVGGRDASNGGDDDNDAALNNYREIASDALQILSEVTIDKQVTPTAAAVGEIVTYGLRIDLIQGTTNAVVVEDVLPTGLEYVGHAISVGHIGLTLGNPAYNARLGSGQTVRFDLGNVVNLNNADNSDDFVLVEIFGRVRNLAANQNGVAVLNGDAVGSPVTVTYNDGAPQTIHFDHDAATPGNQGIPFTVVEPVLGVTKTASPTTQALTDIVTYTLIVSHLAGSAADAYDVTLVDTIPAGMTYIANSVNPPPAFVSFNSGQLTLGYASLPLAEGSRTISYQVRVDATATAGTPLTNSIVLDWASQPGATGAADSGRTGADGAGGALNDYAASASAPVTPTTSAVINATKTVAFATPNGDSNSNTQVDPGDTLQYTVTLTNTGNETVTNVLFTDPVPVNTTYVASSLTLNGVPATNSGTATQLQLNIGSLLSGASATITFQATVNSGVASGVAISNQGMVDSDQTVPEPTDVDGNDGNGDQSTDVTIGSPVGGGSSGPLYATKTINPASVAANGTVTYTIILTNASQATTLTNVQFSDTVPAQIAVTGVSANASFTGQLVTATIASLAPSATTTITITGRASNTVTGVFNNQGAVNYTDEVTTRSTLTDADNIPGNGNQPTPVTITNVSGPQLDVQKRWSLFADTDSTGTPSPGDTLLYTIAYKLGILRSCQASCLLICSGTDG